MKKIFTSIALLSMLAVGCTKTDDLTGTKPGDSFTTAEEASGYMAINIVTPGGANTRAEGEGYNDPNNGSGKYEDGTEYENAVENIRFYFFKDGNGGKVPAKVKKNPESTNDDDTYYSYIDYKVLPHDKEDGTPKEDHSETVEKIVRLTVALNFPEGEEPKYVIAVVNPTAAVTDGFGANPAMPTLAELETQVANFQPTKTGENYDSFIMSSSVYKDNGKVNFAKMGTLFNTMEDAEEALTDPDKRDLLTVIYVERIAARLDLYVKTGAKLKPADDGYEPTDKTNVFMTDKKYRKYDETNAKEIDIYVKFLAWQVISTPKRSNLLKDIAVAADEEGYTWPDALLGANEPWNVVDYHRSFWAINPSVLVDAGHPYDNFVSTESGIDYQFYSYKQILDDGIKSFPASADEAEKVYMQENAAQGNTVALASTRKNHETKVIVAAELKRPDGTTLEIAEYGYKYYDKDDLLEYFADMLPFYTVAYSEPNNPQNAATHMTAADLEYKTHREYTGDAGVDIEGSYYSFVKLKGDKTWYKQGETTPMVQTANENKVQKYIDDEINSSSLLIWEGGKTYYYFTIRHLAGEPTLPEGQKATYEDYQKTPGYYGVVRNHIYRAGINELVGIGTPVFNEDEPIYPEKPNHDGHIMAAEIRVLSWRVVDQEYDFSW